MRIDRSGWSGSAEPSRSWPADLILLTLLAFALAPVWSVQRLPTQDGPSHIYNASVLAQLLRPSSGIRSTFTIRAEPFPNWAGHATLAGLIAVGLDPVMSEKIFLSLYLVGMAFGTRYLLRAIGPGQVAWAPLSLALAYNFPFFMGYYNFLMGIPLALFLLGYAWRHRERLDLGPALILSFGLVMVYFAHLVAFGAASLGTLILMVGGSRPGHRFETLGKLNLICLPAAALLGWFVTSSDRGYVSDAPAWSVVSGSEDGPAKLVGRLASSVLLPTPHHSPIAMGLALTVLGVVILAGAFASLRARRSTEPPATKAPFWVLAVELIALALIFPQNWGNHGGAFTERIAIFIGLIGLACLPTVRTKLGLILTLAASTVVAGLGLSASSAEIHEGDRSLSALLEGLPDMPKGSRVLPMLLHAQPEDRILLLEHLTDYLCLGEGVVNWDDYEARGFCFPVRFREGVEPPDPGDYRRGDYSRLDRDLGRVDVVLAGPRCPQELRDRLASALPVVRRVGKVTIYSRSPLDLRP